MRKAYVKDLSRTFFKSFSRFLSIFFIAMLGSGVFAGLFAVAPNMKNSVSDYYIQQNFMDLRVVSANPLSKADADGLEALTFIESVMPSLSNETISAVGGNDYVVKMHTLPDNVAESNLGYINRLELIEGEMPKNPNECVVVVRASMPKGLGIDGTIEILESRLSLSFFGVTNFKITGIVKTPYYMSYVLGGSAIGSGQIDYVIYVQEDVFLAPVYTELFVNVKGAKDLNQFSSVYDDKIEAARNNIQATSEAYVVLDRNANESHVEFYHTADNMRSIATVFPLIFFLVAALVSLTTMTRLIDEERLVIGTYRALGYSNSKIAFKYISYAFLTTLAGSLIGISVGFVLFTRVIWGAYAIVFNLPTLLISFYFNIMLLTLALMLAFTLFATVYSCIRVLREYPARLLKPKSPRQGKRVFLEYVKPIWKRLSFSYKITARNIFLNKKRFFMTVIGIAGCMALLLIGFGLKDSVNAILSNQFDKVFKYDATAGINGVVTPELQSLLDDKSKVSDYELVFKKTLDVVNIEDGETYDAYLIVPQNSDSLKDFILMQQRIGGSEILFEENSVVVTEKLARELNLKIGSVIEVNFLDDAAVKYEFTITGITENYVLEYVYVGGSAFSNAFGTGPQYNQIFLKTAGGELIRQTLTDELFAAGNVLSVSFNEDTVKSFENSFKSLDSVIIVLIVSAALLAVVVLYNLTNINVIERKREIATLKVLGFYEHETNMYIARETFLLTLFGIAAGIFLGLILFGFVLATVELKVILIARVIKPLSYVFSLCLTAVFSVIVSLMISRKIKGIDMIESLKSVE